MFALALATLPVSVLPHGRLEPAPIVALASQQGTFLEELRGRLKSHPYFSKVALVEVSASPTITLFLQQPQVPAANWKDKLVADRLPWLVQAEKRFLELLATPLGLQRRAEMPVSVVCVLQTAGDYSNYQERVPGTSPYSPGAQFERKQRWTVLFESGGSLTVTSRRTTQSAEFVRSLVLAHYSGAGGEPEQAFFVEGFAGYMAEDAGPTAASIGACKPPPRWTRAIVDALARPEDAFAYVLQLDELGEHATWEKYVRLTNARNDLAGKPYDDMKGAELFHAQGVLWTHFLMDANEGRHRQRYLQYMRHVLEGKGTAAALRGAFEGVRLDEFTRDFLRWVVALDAGYRKSPALPAGTIEGLFATPEAKPAPRAPVVEPAAPKPPARAAQAPASTRTPAFDVERLRTAPEDFPAQHGLALVRASSGHLAEAARRLTELATRASDSNERERLARDLTRLEALQAIRETILKERIASGKKLQFSLPERKVLAAVVAIDGEWLKLGENRAGVERLPLSDFSLEMLAKELPNPAPEVWMKPYLQLLAGDARATKGIGEGAGFADLRVDAAALAERLQVGRAAAELDALADRGLPSEVGAARDACDALKRLLEARRGSPAIEARREALREYARAVHVLCFDPGRAADLWGGKLEALADGQVRWTLDFEKADEAALFTPLPDAWPSYRAQLGAKFTVPAGTLEVKKGRLAIRGGGAWAAPVNFTEVSSCEVRGAHHYELDEACAITYVLVAYKSVESFVAFTATGDLVLKDERAGVAQYELNEIALFSDRPYASRLERANGEWTVTTELPSLERTRDVVPANGRVVLFSHHTEAFLLDSLSVTGRADLAQAAAQWADAQCQRLGL